MGKIHDTSLSFKDQDFFIGIDVHKRQWTLSIVSMNMLLKKYLSIDPSPSVLLKYITAGFASFVLAVASNIPSPSNFKSYIPL